jgi:hypothetical protein
VWGRGVVVSLLLAWIYRYFPLWGGRVDYCRCLVASSICVRRAVVLVGAVWNTSNESYLWRRDASDRCAIPCCPYRHHLKHHPPSSSSPPRPDSLACYLDCTVLRLTTSRPTRPLAVQPQRQRTHTYAAQQTRCEQLPHNISPLIRPVLEPAESHRAWRRPEHELTERPGKHWNTPAKSSSFARRLREQPPPRATSAQQHAPVERCECSYSLTGREGHHGLYEGRRLRLRLYDN